MLSRIHLENFKCFKGVTVDPGLITVFIGPNGSGKSSILQALVLLKQTLKYSPNVTRIKIDGPILNLGAYKEIVFGRERNLDVEIQYIGNLPTRNKPNSIGNSDNISFGYTVRFGPRGGNHELAAHQVDLQAGSFSRNIRAIAGKSEPVAPYEKEDSGWKIELRTSGEIGQPIMISGISGPPGSGSEQTYKLQDSLDEIIFAPRNAIRDYFFFIPANRDVSLPGYLVANKSSNDLLDAAYLARTQIMNHLTNELARLKLEAGLASEFIPEQLLDTTGLATASVLAMEKPRVQNKIRDWSTRVTETEIRSQLQEGPKESIQSRDFNLANEGFGTNTLAFLLTQLAISPEDAMIGIEEPEIHLHPRAQAELANVLVEEATTENKQLILTTHSEHILFSLLTAVAEGKLTPEQLVIYSFEKEKGVANAKHLGVNKDGTVEGGLEGFFQAEVDQFRRYLNAQSKN